MTAHTFEVPWPPTTSNHQYTQAHNGQRFLRADVIQWRALVAWHAEHQGVRCIEAGDVRVVYEYFRPTRRGDLDNLDKLLGDALNGVAWADDKQIADKRSVRALDKANPRVRVTVEAI